MIWYAIFVQVQILFLANEIGHHKSNAHGVRFKWEKDE